MARRHYDGQFLASPLASLAAATTAVEGTDFTSKVVDVRTARTLAVQLVAAGADASSSGALTAYFAGSPREVSEWDTFDDASQPLTSVALTITGTNVQRHSGLIDVRGLAWIKLIALKNGDANYAMANINVNHGRTVEIT